MNNPIDTGDRVAWSASDRGIVAAEDGPDPEGRRRLTVAVWRGPGFSGHVTRLPAALLHRTPRLGTPGASA